MKGMIDRLGGIFWVACLGVVVLFCFFAAIGGFNPGDVLWLTAAVCILAVAFTIHAIRVGIVLREARTGETIRELNELRERRGF
ncbi:MAG: hypothetical protein AABM29_07665 [Actinomycetota bacterium]